MKPPFDTSLTPPAPPTAAAPRSLRDDLADVIGRAVREGNFTLAKALIDAQAATREPLPAEVVPMESARRK